MNCFKFDKGDVYKSQFDNINVMYKKDRISKSIYASIKDLRRLITFCIGHAGFSVFHSIRPLFFKNNFQLEKVFLLLLFGLTFSMLISIKPTK